MAADLGLNFERDLLLMASCPWPYSIDENCTDALGESALEAHPAEWAPSRRFPSAVLPRVISLKLHSSSAQRADERRVLRFRSEVVELAALFGLEGVKHRIGDPSDFAGISCACGASLARALGDTAIDCGMVGACERAAACARPSRISGPAACIWLREVLVPDVPLRPARRFPALTLSRSSTASSRIMSVASSSYVFEAYNAFLQSFSA